MKKQETLKVLLLQK